MTDGGPARLIWIGLRVARGEPMRVVDEADALAGRGLVGDRASRRPGGDRQLTLLTTGDLSHLGGMPGGAPDPARLRRNLVIGHPGGLFRVGETYRLGDLLIRVTGPCEPCARMRAELGEAGYRAMRGHGGVTARILEGGRLRLGQAAWPARDDPFA